MSFLAPSLAPSLALCRSFVPCVLVSSGAAFLGAGWAFLEWIFSPFPKITGTKTLHKPLKGNFKAVGKPYGLGWCCPSALGAAVRLRGAKMRGCVYRLFVGQRAQFFITFFAGSIPYPFRCCYRLRLKEERPIILGRSISVRGVCFLLLSSC